MSQVACCYLQDEHLTATLKKKIKSRGHVTFNSLTIRAHLGMERQYPCQKFGPTFCMCKIICSEPKTLWGKSCMDTTWGCMWKCEASASTVLLGGLIVDTDELTASNNRGATSNNHGAGSLTFEQFLNVRQKKESERQSHFMPKRTTKKKQTVTVSISIFSIFCALSCTVCCHVFIVHTYISSIFLFCGQELTM